MLDTVWPRVSLAFVLTSIVAPLGALDLQAEPAPTMHPGPRSGAAAICDSSRRRMILFGGRPGPHNDVWELSLDEPMVWKPVAFQGTPPSPRWGMAAIHDRARDRMVMFGGFDGTEVNDVWTLSLGATPIWSKLAPQGTPPPPRRNLAAIYDPRRDRMVLFGGIDSSSARRGRFLGDVWALSLGKSPAWTRLDPAGAAPPGRVSMSGTYDPLHDRMVVLGGWDGRNCRNDVWALSLASRPRWSQLAPEGTPPGPRRDMSAVYDPDRRQIVVFGGGDGGYSQESWALSLADRARWVKLEPFGAAPSGRASCAAIVDPLQQRLVIFGGTDGADRDDLHVLWLSGDPLLWLQPPSAYRRELMGVRPTVATSRLTASISLSDRDPASLELVDLEGRVRLSRPVGDLGPGRHEVDLELKEGLSSGVYFVRLTGRGRSRVARIAVVR